MRRIPSSCINLLEHSDDFGVTPKLHGSQSRRGIPELKVFAKQNLSSYIGTQENVKWVCVGLSCELRTVPPVPHIHLNSTIELFLSSTILNTCTHDFLSACVPAHLTHWRSRRDNYHHLPSSTNVSLRRKLSVFLQCANAIFSRGPPQKSEICPSPFSLRLWLDFALIIFGSP